MKMKINMTKNEIEIKHKLQTKLADLCPNHDQSAAAPI